jgi:hypothetical protein
MRRSRQVFAPLLASTAVALLSGCHRQPEMQRCVDENNHVVDPSFCKNLPANSSQPVYSPGNYGTGGIPIFIPHTYRYYYGGGGSYTPGSVVTGGSYNPSSGHSYSTTTGTARGGFGSSFSSHSSGGHGGGGE